MEFICRTSHTLSTTELSLLSNTSSTVIHKAKLDNVYIVASSNIETLTNSKLFTSVRIAEQLELADISLFPHISAKPLTKKSYVGWKVRVAILDSGIKVNNGISIIFSKDFTGYSNQIISEHGTQVAKVVKYFSPKAAFISLKVAHESIFSEANIIPALDEAMEQNADIINMSFGISQKCKGDCEICTYVNLVVDAGYTVVVASGNEGRNFGNSVGCPGKAEKAVTVGQINQNGKLALHSGKGDSSLFKPNILTAGIISTYIDGKPTSSEGTSFAAPVITGVLASMFHLKYNRETLITRLYDSTRRLNGVPGYHQGFGVFDLKKFLEVCEHDKTLSNNG